MTLLIKETRERRCRCCALLRQVILQIKLSILAALLAVFSGTCYLIIFLW